MFSVPIVVGPKYLSYGKSSWNLILLVFPCPLTPRAPKEHHYITNELMTNNENDGEKSLKSWHVGSYMDIPFF